MKRLHSLHSFQTEIHKGRGGTLQRRNAATAPITLCVYLFVVSVNQSAPLRVVGLASY
jgi:hypothetical protein